MEGTISVNSNIVIGCTAVEYEEGTGTLPATNQIAIYAKADKMMYQQDDTGLESLLGGGLDGPAGATVNNRLALWDGITGNLLKESSFIIDAAGDLSGLIGLDVNGANNINLTTSDDDVAAINILASNGGIKIDSSLALDIDAASVDIDTTAAFSLDGAAASNVSVSGAGIDLTLASSLGIVLISGGEAAVDSVRIIAPAAAGGITMISGTAGFNVDTTGAFSIEGDLNSIIKAVGAGIDLSLSSLAGRVIVNAEEATANAITLLSAAGGLDANVALQMNLDSSQAAADAVRIVASNASGGIDINAGSAGIDLLTTGAFSIDGAAASNVSVSGAGIDLTLASSLGRVVINGGEGVADAVRIIASTAGGGVDVDSGSGGISLTTTGNLTIDATGSFSIDGEAASNISVSPPGVDLTLSSALGKVVINGGEADDLAVHINNTDAGGGITINAGSSGLDMDSTGGAVSLSSDRNIGFDIQLNSTDAAGGLDVNVGSSGIDVDMALGTFVLTSTHLDTSSVLELQQTGTNGSDAEVFVGIRDPSATITGKDGSLYIQSNSASSNLYQNVSAGASGTVWARISGFPPNYLDGLLVSDNSVTLKNISAGCARSDDDTFDIVSSGVLTPNVSVSGLNGLDTGSQAADTWYSIWVIADSTGVNAVGSLLSVSSTSPVVPGTHDKKRRIGWVRNDSGSDFYEYDCTSTGKDRLFMWNELATILELLTDGAATSFTNIDISELVPPTSTLAYINTNYTAAGINDFATFRTAGLAGTSPITTPRAHRCYAGGFGTGSTSTCYHIRTDSTQNIEYANATASEETDCWLLGYTDSL